jgi:hypothetical protein
MRGRHRRPAYASVVDWTMPAWLVLAMILLGALTLLYAPDRSDWQLPTAVPVPTETPAEDAPGWLCREHGDRACGVGYPGARTF